MATLKYPAVKFLILILAVLAPACVFVPRTVQSFDADCQVMARQLVLQPVQVAAIHGCANQGCVALIVGAAAISAASAVVSGSVVMAGNLAYWLEKKAHCHGIG